MKTDYLSSMKAYREVLSQRINYTKEKYSNL